MSKLLARFLVYSVCFLLPLGAAANSVSEPETLTIFVKGSSPSLASAREEAARLMAPAGFVLEWKDISERRAGDDYARLVVVELRGNCSAPLGNPTVPAADTRSLASTAIVDGKILPFSTVQCESLRRVMSSAQAGPQLFGRAMGRVIAHELYHMLAETTTHAATGASKSCFSRADLLAERFDFDAVTIASLRPPVAVASTPSEFSSEDSGR